MNPEEVKRFVAFNQQLINNYSNLKSALDDQIKTITKLSKEAEKEMHRIRSQCKHEWPKGKGNLMGRGHCTICNMSDY